MSLMAMDALEEDEVTKSVVFGSKPPHPEVAKKIIARISESAKRYTVCFLGAEKMNLPSNAKQATTLRDAAELALGGAKIGSDFDVVKLAADKKATGGRVRGLFCGGTLCAEAQVVLGSGAVSYTHLDVYKRQTLHAPVFFCGRWRRFWCEHARIASS